MSPRGLSSRELPPRVWLKWSGIVSCVSVAVLAICLNWQAARSNRRVDVTSDHRHTLSAVTQETLARLTDSITIYVLVSHTDPLAVAITPIADGYSSASRRITVRWIDPDRNPGRFSILQSQLGIVSGESKDGKALSDSIAVLERGKRRSYVTVDDIAQPDPRTGDSEPRVEQALTRAIQRLLDSSRPVVCFTQGHHERVLDDVSPEGLSELKAKLTTDSVDLRVIELAESSENLAWCALLVVPEPELPLDERTISQISDYRDRVGSLWVMSGTVPDDTGKARTTGVDALVANLGVSLGANVIIENDARRRFPDGFGETFFAQPSEHAITRALGTDNPNRSLRVLVSLAPTVEVAKGAPFKLLLTSSPQAVAIQDLGSYLKATPDPQPQRIASHELAIAVAAELGESSNHVKRRVVVSPASIAINRALRSPGLAGNRVFVDGALSWLLARPSGVEIAASQNVAPPLEVSESDLKRIDRYVLLIMPGAALVLWLAFLVASRRREGI